jgi:S1-C subfamily serine protease
MQKLTRYIFWPTLAGGTFSLALMFWPQLFVSLPLLNYWTSSQQPPEANLLTFSSAIKRAVPAVVSINNREVVPRPVLTIRGLMAEQTENISLGSGVIINEDGFIITSYHVMFNPDVRVRIDQDIVVTLNDQRTYAARLVMLDESNDLALLKIDADKLHFLQAAQDSMLEVGDVALAIGTPRNIGQSVTFGIISALWRRDDSYVIQTDAAINPGNSGGALINIKGELIGINSSIVSGSGGSEGISFAVPASKAMSLLSEYLASGPSGYLGVNAVGITIEQGYQLFDRDIQGFLINEVSQNSAADKAGMKVNDVITAINGKKLIFNNPSDIEEASSIIANISELSPGEVITLEIFRAGKEIQLTAILGIGEPQLFTPLASP